jgi:aryl-alcohol dehydrogenase-like predicted oxidoreductase
MEKIRLGNTGLSVSRICLGTMTYGTPKWRDWGETRPRSGQIGPVDRFERRTPQRRATKRDARPGRRERMRATRALWS